MTSAQAARRGRVRLIDIAREAGVHHTTVSAVLNNYESCYASARTRRRILAAAARLNYRPSALARGLVGQRTATLGIVTTGYEIELVIRMVHGFEEAAREHDQFLLVVNSGNRPELEDRAIQHLLDRAVDGIAIWPCHEGPHDELRRLVSRRFPVVIFGLNDDQTIQADRVYDDPTEAGRLQAQHLIDLGRRKIWLIESSQRCGINDCKTAGFEEAMNAAGLPLRRFVLHSPAHSQYAMYTSEFEQFRALFTRHAGEIDAVAAQGDQLAQAVIRIAVEQGLRVPDDVAVMGIGGLVGSADGALPLSTVGFDAEKVGRAALELLSEQLNGKRAAGRPKRVVIRPYLQPRASTLGLKSPES